HNDLERLSVREILEKMNAEDAKVAVAVGEALPALERLIEGVVERMRAGGRLFYIGAGTAGRLGIVDASECPPTFGVPPDLVVGIIAGGDGAVRRAVEFAEDNPEQGWKDLLDRGANEKDAVVGISASGYTPYVLGALESARKAGMLTGAIVCNPRTPIAAAAQYPVEIVVGPEFVTGSTRLKAGTAQKMALNMISTATMIRLGRVMGNKMADMQLANRKLIDRGTRYVAHATGLSPAQSMALLIEYGSVRAALAAFRASENSSLHAPQTS
ncbi:MAG: N-acetylmuramic acid 6-phosphate etherase, partial [Bacteroidia bacterium]|nr:N-acetylmuramic acid 6-phosphate etherase [Bacteroidia bacterium]